MLVKIKKSKCVFFCVYCIMTLQDEVFKKIKYDPKNISAKFIKTPKITEKDRVISIYPKDYQIDLVTMPDDGGYKYICVIVNITTKLIDCVPQKTKTAEETADSLKLIDARVNTVLKDDIISLQSDQGSEFVNEKFVKACFDLDIQLRFASVRRKNQQAMVEHSIGLITKFLYHKMSQESIRNDKRNRVWVKYVNIVRDEINKFNYKKFEETKKGKIQDIFKMVAPLDKLNDLIPIGVIVYPRLFKPMDTLEDTKLFGKMRYGDVRFDYEHPAKIKEWLIRSGRPVRYRLETMEGEQINDTTFLKQELIVKDRQPRTVGELTAINNAAEQIRTGKKVVVARNLERHLE